MSKKTIITHGNLAKGFKAFITEEYPELNCVVAEKKEDIEKLLPAANFAAGFNFLNGQNIEHLEWIHAFSAGVDGFMQLEFPKDCAFTKTKGKMGQRMAEYCISYILQDLYNNSLFKANQALKKWEQVIPNPLSKQSVVIFGTGNISTDIAQVLQPMVKNIIGINFSGKNKEFFDVCLPIEKLEDGKIEKGSIIINTLPATESTKNLFNKEVFSDLEDILFINIGRGHSVDEHDLIEALNKNQVRHAILDVFKNEPLEADSPFWNHPKCIVTPHISGITLLEDVKQSFKVAYESIKSGEPCKLSVDIEKGY